MSCLHHRATDGAPLEWRGSAPARGCLLSRPVATSLAHPAAQSCRYEDSQPVHLERQPSPESSKKDLTCPRGSKRLSLALVRISFKDDKRCVQHCAVASNGSRDGRWSGGASSGHLSSRLTRPHNAE